MDVASVRTLIQAQNEEDARKRASSPQAHFEELRDLLKTIDSKLDLLINGNPEKEPEAPAPVPEKEPDKISAPDRADRKPKNKK